MKTIWKFELTPGNTSECIVHMPPGAEILSAHSQGDTISLWATVDTTLHSRVPRTFHVIGTGHEIPEFETSYPKFINTVRMDGMVFHVFEQAYKYASYH